MLILVLRKQRGVLWSFLCLEMSSSFLSIYFWKKKKTGSEGSFFLFVLRLKSGCRFFFSNHPIILL